MDAYMSKATNLTSCGDCRSGTSHMPEQVTLLFMEDYQKASRLSALLAKVQTSQASFRKLKCAYQGFEDSIHTIA
jgi:hypothetical protein